MIPVHKIDNEISRLIPIDEPSRPFLCSGFPVGCEVATVGINPATDTPFWPYWNSESGFDKHAWIEAYKKRHGRLKPTRDRLEIFCAAVAPVRCIELNLYNHASRSEISLAKSHRSTEVFEFMLAAVKPKVLLVYGNTPIRHLSRLLGVTPEKGCFTETKCFGHAVVVFASKRHFAYVSREYAAKVGERVRKRIQEMGVPA